MARANERGYAFSVRFERFAANWADFVNQNKAAEDEFGRQDSAQAAGEEANGFDQHRARRQNRAF